MTDSEKLKELQRIVVATITMLDDLSLPFTKEETMIQGFKELAKACEWHQQGKSYSKELEKEMGSL